MCVPRRVYNALLSVMTMRRILATAAALCLGGCITVYGPVKTGGQQQQDSQSGQQPGMSEQISTSFIGNRKPDELLNAVELYFREKAITASVNDPTTGIIAGNGSVIQQILPTFYVNRLQQQFSKYFSSLQIALADVDPPVYNISAITNSGSKIVAQVYV